MTNYVYKLNNFANYPQIFLQNNNFDNKQQFFKTTTTWGRSGNVATTSGS